MVREIIERIEDDIDGALMSLDQSKFDRVDHWFCKYISMLYHSSQVNRNYSESFATEQLIRQDCPLSPLLYVLALEPLLRRLKDKEANPTLCRVPFVGCHKTKVSEYANDITVFVSRFSDTEAEKKAR